MADLLLKSLYYLIYFSISFTAKKTQTAFNESLIAAFAGMH